MTDWQRLEQIIRWTGLSTNAFAFSIGLKRSQNLYQIKRHRNRISKDLADRIVRRYPVFDRSWLLTGDGPSPDLSSLPLPPRPDTASGRIPFYPLDALRLASDPSLLATAQPDGHLSIPGIDDCDLAALVTRLFEEVEYLASGQGLDMRLICPADRLVCPASQEALAEFLASIPALATPWDGLFQRTYCAVCSAENCDAENCPHQAERNSPAWFLAQEVADSGNDPLR